MVEGGGFPGTGRMTLDAGGSKVIGGFVFLVAVDAVAGQVGKDLCNMTARAIGSAMSTG